MRVNTKFTVAVHILTLLELRQDNPAASDAIAESVGTHPVVVRKIMSMLRNAGLIETKSGLPGGILAKPQEEISLYDIYMATKQNPDAPYFDVHSKSSKTCQVGRYIEDALEEPLFGVQTAMEDALKRYSLKDITSFILEKHKS